MSTEIISTRERAAGITSLKRRLRKDSRTVNAGFPALFQKNATEQELRWEFPLGFISWKASTGYRWYGLEGDPWMEFMTMGAITIEDGLAVVHERHPDMLAPVTPAIFQAFFGELEPFPYAYGYCYEHFREPYIAPDGERFATLTELKQYSTR